LPSLIKRITFIIIAIFAPAIFFISLIDLWSYLEPQTGLTQVSQGIVFVILSLGVLFFYSIYLNKVFQVLIYKDKEECPDVQN